MTWKVRSLCLTTMVLVNKAPGEDAKISYVPKGHSAFSVWICNHMRLNLLKKIAYTFMSSFIKIVATQIVNCAYLQSCIQMLGMHLLFVYVSVCDDQPTCLSPICFAWKSGPFFSSYGHNSVWIRDCLRADVSYFLCCTREKESRPFSACNKGNERRLHEGKIRGYVWSI